MSKNKAWKFDELLPLLNVSLALVCLQAGVVCIHSPAVTGEAGRPGGKAEVSFLAPGASKNANHTLLQRQRHVCLQYQHCSFNRDL